MDQRQTTDITVILVRWFQQNSTWDPEPTPGDSWLSGGPRALGQPEKGGKKPRGNHAIIASAGSMGDMSQEMLDVCVLTNLTITPGASESMMVKQCSLYYPHSHWLYRYKWWLQPLHEVVKLRSSINIK
jgi:hypothetical protein